MPTHFEMLSSRSQLAASPGVETHNATISVITWFLLIVSAFSMATRFLVKSLIARSFNWDDGFALASLAFNAGAGIALSFAAQYGLGRDDHTIQADELIRLEKSTYAFEALHVTTLCFAKLSIIALLNMLFSSHHQRRSVLVLGGLILASTVAFVFTILFQCNLPNPWGYLGSNTQCIDLVIFWRAVGIVSILTDIGLIVLPYMFLRRLKMSMRRKALVVLCFSARAIDVVACITQLCYTHEFHHQNRTAAVWPWFIIGQVIETVTMISSSAPYLRQFLDIFPSGMFQSDELRRRGLDYSEPSKNSNWTVTLNGHISEVLGKGSGKSKSSDASPAKSGQAGGEKFDMSTGGTRSWGEKADDDEALIALRPPSNEMAIAVRTTLETKMEPRHDSDVVEP